MLQNFEKAFMAGSIKKGHSAFVLVKWFHFYEKPIFWFSEFFDRIANAFWYHYLWFFYQ